jgi:hypothetical protein
VHGRIMAPNRYEFGGMFFHRTWAVTCH